MADNMIGEIRRSSVVMSFGPGSIMDMRGGGGPVSGVSAGLEEWESNAPLQDNLKHQKIIERRLCKKLHKKFFRLPPVLQDGAKIPETGKTDTSALVARRFPEWLQCPICGTIQPVSKWKGDPGRAYRYCAECTEKQPGLRKVFVVPVRFVTVCTNGHLDDFPWNFWVNHKKGCTNKDRLKLVSKGPGLAGMILSCPECHATRSMDGIFSKHALAGLKCRGKRPWLRSDDSICECTGTNGNFRVAQRGASNLYYPVIESALDIPPWTRKLERILGDYWDTLQDIPDMSDRIRYIESSQNMQKVMKRERITAEDLAKVFERMIRELDELKPEEIRLDEYRVFSSGLSETDMEFEIFTENLHDRLKPFFFRVLRVPRLREVRVLKGFTRITPPFDPDGSNVAPLSERELDWLPAIEMRGEGFFIQFNTDKLEIWGKNFPVLERCKKVEKGWTNEWKIRNPEKQKPFSASPKFMLIHTFAHALIKQLTLECGYSTASLRERLYVSDERDGMAGVLIYTANADSDGTLGGLQRRAIPDLLESTVIGSIRSSRWCSSDPLCINGEISAPESHSIASCHACTMVPETSCEFHNQFLDRALLVGNESGSEIGFFNGIITEE